jgi:hypothetical protein
MREAGEGAVLWLLWKPTSEGGTEAGTNASHGARPRPHYITASIIPDINRDARSRAYVSLYHGPPRWRCLGCALITSLRPAREGEHGNLWQSRPLCCEACLTYPRHEDPA